MNNKRLISFLGVIFPIIIIAVITFCYFFLTNEGSVIIAKFVFRQQVMARDIKVEAADGTLKNEMSFKNIEFSDLNGFPKGSVLRIQKLDVKLRSLNLKDVIIEVENARLVLPASAPIIFYGSYRNQNMNFNIYSKTVDVQEIISLLRKDKEGASLRGALSDLDVTIKGTLSNLIFNGKFLVEQLTTKEFLALNIPGALSLHLEDVRGNFKLYGDVVLKKGLFIVRDTNISIKESKMSFSGDPENPALFINGVSNIDTVKITIVLRGTANRPDLQLTSNPPKSQQALMVMLATGKSWEGFETSLNQGQLSPDLARDLIDYLLLAGSGGKLAQKLGIKDIRFTSETNKKNFDIKKAISQKLDMDYSIQQVGEQSQPKQINQKIGGDLKVTEKVSVSAEKEIRKQAQLSQDQVKPAEDKLLLKYKTDF